ncbi:uncharacterized protein LOC123678657 [Harmonia axyridis]|uniref:uncharacterized protein LOC123678657 n=1 Tax=Harmonia axyridis TaxID=115357 RepID=UPI001E279701|nr:uncharacterized protein LOC123678657 [Harmonia axyridis]
MEYYRESQDVKKIKKTLDVLYVAVKYRPELEELYKKTKKEYDRALSIARKNHNGKIISEAKNKTKMVWRVIKDTTGYGSLGTGKPIMNGNPEQVFDDFNSYFANIAPNITTAMLHSGDGSTFEVKKVENSFYMFDITDAEIRSKILKFNNINKSSTGYDDVPIKVTKKALNLIIEPLKFIMNCSFKKGIFLDSLKVNIVKPLFKRGAPNDYGNYRPISLITAFAELFEKVLAERLLSFIKKFNVITKHQHGFTEGRSTQSAIFDLTWAIVTALEKREVPDALFGDSSKAFDQGRIQGGGAWGPWPPSRILYI